MIANISHDKARHMRHDTKEIERLEAEDPFRPEKGIYVSQARYGYDEAYRVI